MNTLDMGYPSTARHVTFSPDGRFLAALQATSPEQVYVWDASTFQQMLSFRASDQYPAFHGAMTFSPDGKLLATGHDSGETSSGIPAQESCCTTLSGHAEEILALAFAPNGTSLLPARKMARCGCGDWRLALASDAGRVAEIDNLEDVGASRRAPTQAMVLLSTWPPPQNI